MGLSFHQVDAFTSEPFAGNPAVVFLLSAPAEAAWMQQVAAEMCVPETAFVTRAEDGSLGIRWFTPKMEVMLCGHATLASAHVLWESGAADVDQVVTFQSPSGPLHARRAAGCIELDFPTEKAEPAAPAPFLLEALRVTPVHVARNRRDYLVEIATEDELRALAPDAALLARSGARGLIVTCRSTQARFDFVSRYFSPGEDVLEDPVTGSAHCCLSAYWAPRLGKQEMVGYQASARGGVVEVSLRGDRTLLRGDAVTVVKGELLGAAPSR